MVNTAYSIMIMSMILHFNVSLLHIKNEVVCKMTAILAQHGQAQSESSLMDFYMGTKNMFGGKLSSTTAEKLTASVSSLFAPNLG